MLASGVDTAKNVAIVVVVVLLVAAVVTAKIVSNVTKKVLTLIILVGIAALVFSQRQSLKTCADKASTTQATTCTFFGHHFTITPPTPTK